MLISLRIHLCPLPSITKMCETVGIWDGTISVPVCGTGQCIAGLAFLAPIYWLPVAPRLILWQAKIPFHFQGLLRNKIAMPGAFMLCTYISAHGTLLHLLPLLAKRLCILWDWVLMSSFKCLPLFPGRDSLTFLYAPRIPFMPVLKGCAVCRGIVDWSYMDCFAVECRLMVPTVSYIAVRSAFRKRVTGKCWELASALLTSAVFRLVT